MRAPSLSRRSGLLLLVAAAVPALAVAACETVNLGEPPADINACRPSQSYFVYGTAMDGGTNNGIWQDVLGKDYGGKHCHDSACHGAGSKNSLKLTVPSCVPPGCNPPLPLTLEWADNYRAVAEQMNCANVSASRLLTLPSGLQTHGGGKLFDVTDPEADVIIGWPGAAP
jgi:hypothetical protein